MKKALIFIWCILLLMTACSTTKKVVQTKETTNVSTQKVESETTNTEKLIDTTKTEKGKITITEIEFYPPTVSNDPKPPDEKPSPKPSSNVSGLSLPNVGNIDNAAIKSIKQTTIEKGSETKGESKESSSTESIKSETISENTEKTGKVDETSAPDPYRWRYIFYILLIGVAAFLYFKRVPILNWIKTILSGVRKIF